MTNPVPLTVPLATRLVKDPVEAVPEPMAPGDANVAPPRVEALTAVLQVKPLPEVQLRALAEVLQEGTGKAVGEAGDAVALATTVLAACAPKLLKGTEPAGKLAVVVTVRLGILTGPVKVAPARGAYNAN